MKIVVVHQHYLMPGQPGGSRFNEMARLWSEAGHQVTVIAGNLNYATGEVPERYRGRWIVREQDGPVTVLRCHVPSSYSKSYVGRAQAFLGFTLSAATAALQVERPDVVIATSPPLVAVLPGWLAARAHWPGVPWIFEVRDLWPESAVTTGVLRADSPVTRALYALEAWACRSAARVNVLTPAFREDLVRRGLVPPERVVFVPNGADVEAFRPGPRDNDVRRAMGWGERFVVMYAGAHGRANAVRQLLDAAGLLRHRPDILIATVGDGPERAGLEAEAKARGLPNVMFCGPQPKARMPDFVNACDVGAAVLQNNPTFRTVYPNKVFDYMACERPSLLAIDGVARALVCDEAQAGVFAEPENPAALADAIVRLEADPAGRAAMGRRGREWVLANATRESLAARYLDIMRDVVAR
jgi:glycosyltransferase involved in cell wall biosynthesis